MLAKLTYPVTFDYRLATQGYINPFINNIAANQEVLVYHRNVVWVEPLCQKFKSFNASYSVVRPCHVNTGLVAIRLKLDCKASNHYYDSYYHYDSKIKATQN